MMKSAGERYPIVSSVHEFGMPPVRAEPVKMPCSSSWCEPRIPVLLPARPSPARWRKRRARSLTLWAAKDADGARVVHVGSHGTWSGPMAA